MYVQIILYSRSVRSVRIAKWPHSGKELVARLNVLIPLGNMSICNRCYFLFLVSRTGSWF